jgi:hypothetical protein
VIREVLRKALFEYGRLSARLGPPESPWERVPIDVPPMAFGAGCDRSFIEYLAGQSVVPVPSIEAMIEWLLGCEYASDPEQFHEPDVWQHPTMFETRRRGDCEDFALWAWRKLADLGVGAEFFVGRVLDREPCNDRRHAWVVYAHEGGEYLLEPAAGERNRMIHSLPAVREGYVPHFAVDHRGSTCAFTGYLLDARVQERTSATTKATKAAKKASSSSL